MFMKDVNDLLGKSLLNFPQKKKEEKEEGGGGGGGGGGALSF
jgi:hypothetical protein